MLSMLKKPKSSKNKEKNVVLNVAVFNFIQKSIKENIDSDKSVWLVLGGGERVL